MKTLGIIGFGDFGQFMARHLRDHFDLRVTNRSDKSAAADALGVAYVTHEDCAACDVVILCVPVQNLEDTLACIAPHVKPGALVLDVASVKVRPLEMMSRLLPPTAEYAGTHPMFGPQSGKDGIQGLKVVLCEGRTPRMGAIRSFLADTLQLHVLEMPAEHHDRAIAHVQGLTHWISRAVQALDLPDRTLATPAYEHFLRIGEILKDDSMALFLTIERENPFAKEARAALLDKLRELEGVIENDSPGA